MSANILIILGHPSLKSFNAALAKAYEDGARQARANVRVLNLVELDFDPIFRPDLRQALEPDLERAQRDIEWADHVAWFFPLWWGSLPALLRAFVDRTFLPGWAYNTKPNGMPVKHLAGRTSRTAITMDAPGWFYRFWYGRAAHYSMERATLWYCGLDVIGRTTLHGIDHSSLEQRQTWLSEMTASAVRDVAKVAKRQRALPVQTGAGA